MEWGKDEERSRMKVKRREKGEIGEIKRLREGGESWRPKERGREALATYMPGF